MKRSVTVRLSKRNQRSSWTGRDASRRQVSKHRALMLHNPKVTGELNFDTVLPMNLTRRQREILEFITASKARDGFPPTRAEIVRHFGFKSPNAAQCHLRALADHGAVRLMPGTARGIIPVQDKAEPPGAPGLTLDENRLPLIGRVTAGTPILAVENHEDDLVIDPKQF